MVSIESLEGHYTLHILEDIIVFKLYAIKLQSHINSDIYNFIEEMFFF